MFDLQALNLPATLPAFILAIGACIMFAVDVFVPQNRKDITAALALIGLAVSFVLSFGLLNSSTTAFNGMFMVDSFTALVNLIALVACFLGILVAHDYMKRTKIERGEFYPLLLLTAAGGMFMGAAGDLIIVLIALEILSIPLYVMAGFRRDSLRSEESAMKYFLLGAFATGFLVYGIALIYGSSGTTNLHQIFTRAQQGGITSNFLLLMGTGLILVGLGFKVAAVPFHMWTPDVYQGAPTPITAYMSVGAKLGGFAALLRILTIAVPSFVIGAVKVDPGQTIILHAAWQDAVAIMAGMTMILGNVVAIMQRDIKRLLAYSSIAHAGYILMAVAAAGTFQITADSQGNQSVSMVIAESAIQGALVYLMAYAFTNIGAFAVAISVEHDDETGTLIDDFAGLGQAHPLLGAALTLFLLSLTGIPLTGGFVGKWFVFFSSVNAGLTLLALIGVLTSAISAYYYLRVIIKVWFEPGEGLAQSPGGLTGAIALCAAGTLLIGILPAVLTSLTQTVTLLALR
jgi:NADH-quinone oxidoreductase subunit N